MLAPVRSSCDAATSCPGTKSGAVSHPAWASCASCCRRRSSSGVHASIALCTKRDEAGRRKDILSLQPGHLGVHSFFAVVTSRHCKHSRQKVWPQHGSVTGSRTRSAQILQSNVSSGKFPPVGTIHTGGIENRVHQSVGFTAEQTVVVASLNSTNGPKKTHVVMWAQGYSCKSTRRGTAEGPQKKKGDRKKAVHRRSQNTLTMKHEFLKTDTQRKLSIRQFVLCKMPGG